MTELAKNVLGPRDGISETISRDPLNEYVTGVLAPIKSDTIFDADQNGALPETESREYAEDGNGERVVFGERHPSPSLDPRNIPSSMGLSFFVNTDKPKFKVCITWSRYSQGEDKKWTRSPSYSIFDIDESSEPQKKFDGSGKQQADDADVDISFDYRVILGKSGKRVLMSVVNRIQVPKNERKTTPYCIFQPQIRVVCGDNTELKTGFRMPTFGSDDDMDKLVYKGRDFMAVGRLTSAVWKQIDPERRYGGPTKSEDQPFGWLDGEALSEEDRERFTAPDVRTEYIPTFSVPAPDLEWHRKAKPEFSAHSLADMYDPVTLRNALSPITDEYEAWIDGVEKQVGTLGDGQRKVGREMIGNCRKAHRRIVAGVDLLCNDADARLAFCFANKAVDTQYAWSRDDDSHLVYRPYQLAFILATLESAIDKTSEDRDVCDLLWVPTGTGKTEAYLAVMAMVMSYRRLRALRYREPGAGVSVITRYTLRLLTVQQFRRTLAVVAAADYLRVYGMGSGEPAGWRPTGCGRGDHLVWGSTPFSIGLWVGDSLTPNNMESYNYYTKKQHVSNRGALDILKDNRTHTSDPAQIVGCPACKAVLAIPDDGLSAGKIRLHFVAKAESGLPASLPTPDIEDGIRIESVSSFKHAEPGFVTISMDLDSGARPIKPTIVTKIWTRFEQVMRNKHPLSLEAVSPPRPGYFERTYLDKNGSAKPYDFDIVCPNPECPLRIKWVGGSPCGKTHATKPWMQYDVEVDGKTVPDGNHLETVITPFRMGGPCVSDRIPLRAFTVDDQVYKEVPSIVVATVDKFARLPFKPETGQLFGNVDRHHCKHGYERSGKKSRNDAVELLDGLGKPDMIIQDEFHLLEGPLGSMVGAYETAVDFLTSDEKLPVKYLAATATIRRPKDHVRSILNRNIMVFPPMGIGGDRFFVRDLADHHQLDDENPGRLYLGICCPGRGSNVPLVRLWSSLLQTAYAHQHEDGIDDFWTLTGYFNTVRELAGAAGMYRQDIKSRVEAIAPGNARKLETEALELSSRTESARLPSILDKLDKSGPDGGAPDSLFTTAMFGTGVDVSRLGLMVMNGQPKTATAYIQATGRVGRRRGALVVTLFGAARPRDLSYYEFFARHHLQLHRFVEPVTVHPFASGTMARAAGPVALGMLLNMRGADSDWPDNARHIIEGKESSEVRKVVQYMEHRAQNQPEMIRPDKGEIADKRVKPELGSWESVAKNNKVMKYKEYGDAKYAVVLGDQQHESHMVAFENAPQSLRELEEEVDFET